MADLEQVVSQLLDPAWSTFHAIGRSSWNLFVRQLGLTRWAQGSTGNSERVEIADLSPVVASSQTPPSIWSIWANSEGLIRLEERDINGHNPTLTLWNNDSWWSYSSTGRVMTNEGDPRMTYSLSGLEPLVDASLLATGLDLCVIATGSWVGRDVVQLRGIPRSGNAMEPFSDESFSGDLSGHGIGVDEYLITLEVDSGLIIGIAALVRSLLSYSAIAEEVEINPPLDDAIFEPQLQIWPPH